MSTNPVSATTGDIYYDTTSNKIRYYNGNAWISLSSETQSNPIESYQPTIISTKRNIITNQAIPFNDFTIEGWVYLDSTTNAPTIIGFSRSVFDNSFKLSVSSTQNWVIGCTDRSFTFGTKITLCTWTHIIIRGVPKYNSSYTYLYHDIYFYVNYILQPILPPVQIPNFNNTYYYVVMGDSINIIKYCNLIIYADDVTSSSGSNLIIMNPSNYFDTLGIPTFPYIFNYGFYMPSFYLNKLVYSLTNSSVIGVVNFSNQTNQYIIHQTLAYSSFN